MIRNKVFLNRSNFRINWMGKSGGVSVKISKFDKNS
jgi:hypothetical protein